MEFFLVIFLGLPLLISLLALPFLIIATPFRWRRQSKRIQGIEDRLERLEGRYTQRARVAHGKPELLAYPSESSKEVEKEPPPVAVSKAAPVEKLHVESEEAQEVAPPVPAPEAEVKREPPAPARLPAGLAAVERAKREVLGSDWERALGTRWLSVVGIIVLVVGIVLFIGYSLRDMGPMGRVGTGFATASLLLFSGWLLERVETYRVIGRTLLGGGWAIAYFTAYAAHNLPEARVIEDPKWGLVLLSTVALGMIGHSFRYRSERITGLGYGLAFLAIAVSPMSDLSLIATGLLGASLVAVLRVMPWYYLGTAGVLATYACFAMWHELLAAGDPMFTESNFALGMGMLVFYWVAFSIAQFLRKPGDARERDLLLTLVAVNCAGFLGLGAYIVYRIHADELHVFTGLSAIAFAGLAWMLRRASLRGPFLLHALAAIILVGVSVPLLIRYYGIDYDWLALPWAVVSAVVLVLGFRLHELMIRVAGYLLSGLAVVAIAALNLWGVPPDSHLVLWLTMPPIIAFFFVAFEVLKARAGHSDVLKQAREVGLAFGYVATALLAAFVWVEGPERLAGVLWLAAGVVMLEVGYRKSRPHVRAQGFLLAGAGLAALVLVNLYDVLPSAPLQVPDWVLVALAAGGYYGIYLRTRGAWEAGRSLAVEPMFSEGAAYAATALVALLLWFKVDSVSLGVCWALQGLVLFELGGRLKSNPLRLSGHIVALAAFSRLFVANFTALGVAGAFSHRLLSVVPVVAILGYLDFALRDERRRGGWSDPIGAKMQVIYTYATVVALVVLLRFELGRETVVVAWAVLMLALLALGKHIQDRDLRLQAYVLSALCFAQSWATNLTLTGSILGLPERSTTTSAVIASFLVAAGYTYHWPRPEKGRYIRDFVRRLDGRAYQFFGLLAATLLAVLLAYEVERQWITVAWTIEAFVVLTSGFLLVERSYRIYGLVLLLACLVKLVAFDLKDIETIYRILTFIVLGVFLVLASFIYTRYQDVIRRYL